MKKQAVVEFCFPGYKTEDTGKWHVNAPLSLFAELSQSMPKLSYALILSSGQMKTMSLVYALCMPSLLKLVSKW